MWPLLKVSVFRDKFCLIEGVFFPLNRFSGAICLSVYHPQLCICEKEQASSFGRENQSSLYLLE